ncbi:MAG: cysteine--tRNA ligase [Deltaproteobacteria bacterium]|nr:cysteine--tRNA ligase [Deltaproteobacteria bacterium]
MSLQIYDTKIGKKIPFTPLRDNHVRIYACGITAYDFCHLGHARSALVFDMIVSYLRHSGYKVTFVRNFTDIDDKIINRAQKQNTTCAELSQRFIDEFYIDMKALKITPPDYEPRATEHIPEIIDIIEKLMTKGIAYQADGDVYFEVEKFPQYGSLSGRNLDDLKAGARISINKIKKNPMDFALWKASKPGEPKWDSPWGEGRPGWHIECSAMSRKYLGDSFDIHGGGEDLVFPHHENELAQSEGASGKPFANHWIHHAFVTIRDEKMSKSLHNFLTIREVLKRHQPEALRMMVFATHYRHPLDFSESGLRDAQTSVNRLYNCMAACAALTDGTESSKAVATRAEIDKLRSLPDRFQEAMDNDFNTAQGLGCLFDAVKSINRISQALPAPPAQADINLLRRGGADVTKLAQIMGLLSQEPQAYLAGYQEKHLTAVGMDKAELNKLLEERIAARQNKEWGRADEIRDLLLAKNIELKDSQDGTAWYVAGDRGQ